MKRISLFSIICLTLSFYSYGQSPLSHPDSTWLINNTFSDEFNTGQLDVTKWDHDPNDWGTWSWEPDNAYVLDTVLALQMVQKTHVRNGEDYYFTSGIIRNFEKMTYGYYEARIKASDKGQGTCPAFWTYSRGEPTPTEEGGVKYCEIDAIEIFQIPYDTMRLEMNLHARIIQDGVLTWIRPGQGHAELTHNTWLAPWDPRDEYHTYGVWNRLDSIFWYVDGVQRGAKKNWYWHLPMNPTVSLGLRAPYEMYINGVRTVMPFPDSIPEPGFPTEMYCDYVRVWNTSAQLYADKEEYYNAEFYIGDGLEFDVRYFAGNGESVLSDEWNGITCKLQEIDANGNVINEIEEVDANAVGKETGLSTFNFSLAGLTPSSSLPSGNQYVLRPVFKSSVNGGETVYMYEPYYPVQLIEGTDVNELEAKEKIKITNTSDGVYINIEDFKSNEKVNVYDISGKLLYSNSTSLNNSLIAKNVFPSSGIYVVSVMTGNLHRVERVAVVGN